MTLLTPILALALAIAPTGDRSDSQLSRLWDSYERARNSDRPADMLSALKEIKQAAVQLDSAWDYYDASQKYVQTASSMNWKLRESLTDSMDREIAEIDWPVMTFFHSYRERPASEMTDFAALNRERLGKARNQGFYKADYRLNSLPGGGLLSSLLDNDYDYVLWSAYATDRSEAREALKENVTGRYPFDIIMQLEEASSAGEKERESILRMIADSCSGKAASLLAESSLLELRFSVLQGSARATQADYIELDKECDEILGRIRKALKSKDMTERSIAAHVTFPESLRKILNGSQISLSVKKDVLAVSLVNLGSAKLSIRREGDGKALQTRVLHNKTRSFFLPDSLFLPLDWLEDGDYAIEACKGKSSSTLAYGKRSLSIAVSGHSEGFAAYVTDFWTGEPCGTVSLILRESGREITRAELAPGDGFRDIPSGLISLTAPGSYNFTVQATDRKDGKTRLSPEIPLYVPAPNNDSGTEPSGRTSGCVVLTDRSAFNPDETVFFKAVVYDLEHGRMVSATAGRKISARISAPDGKDLEQLDLTTDDFGSVDGSFFLEKGLSGGLYTIRIEEEGRILASRSVRVDEFVLPDFTVAWDDETRPLLCGDSPSVTGSIRAFNGHGLDIARAEYEISRYGTPVARGKLDADPEGKFSIRFGTSGSEPGGYFRISVSLTASSGETHVFEKGVLVMNYLYAGLNIQNPDKGSFTMDGSRSGGCIVSADTLEVELGQGAYGKDGKIRPDFRAAYSLVDGSGAGILSGESAEGRFSIRLDSVASGYYTLKCKTFAVADDGTEYRDSTQTGLIVMSGTDTVLHAGALSFFRETGKDTPSVQIGSGQGAVWAVAQLFGDGDTLLDSRTVILEGKPGCEGSLETIEFDRKPCYPDDLAVSVMFFKHAEAFSYTRNLRLPHEDSALPLSITGFTDTTAPGSTVTVEIGSAPDSECTASVFDIASESIMPNTWNRLIRVSPAHPSFRLSMRTGSQDSRRPYYLPLMTKAYGTAGMNGNAVASVEERVAADSDALYEPETVTHARENFKGTLAWEPSLRSDGNGKISFSFNTSDKLSTYALQLFAHDRDMNSAVARKELLVTLPVSVSIAQPQFLYASDRYTVLASASSISDKELKGTFSISVTDGRDYGDPTKVMARHVQTVVLEPKGSTRCSLPVQIPDNISELGVLVSFTSDEGSSDAMFVTVPVRTPVQTITEAHSSLLTDGKSREAVTDSLRLAFANADPSEAKEKEFSILEMLLRDLPRKFTPESDNVLDLLQALYADCLDRRARELPAFAQIKGAAPSSNLSLEQRDTLTGKILGCRNSDGGFGWFSGMPSSARITAVILEWCADMGPDCPAPLAALLPDAVSYLDRSYFSGPALSLRPAGLNLAEYLYVRSLYPGQAIDPGNDSGEDRLKAFRQEVSEYLIPEEGRGLNAMILAKARRLRTSEALMKAGSKSAFAVSVGIKADSRLEESIAADLESIVQYAQPHPSGGVYFPNAVMPARGLLESELYAHCILCNLLGEHGYEDLAEGIRLWIMVQKESQNWENDFACLNAFSTVLAADARTLSARVLVLSATTPLPFGSIAQSGNGMSIRAEYSVGGKPLEEGQTLHLGDIVRAEYTLWSAENRSFVKVTLPRNAAFRPARQLSGPVFLNGYAYRNVTSWSTEYWFETLPEETTVITEELMVTQEGEFACGAPEVSSHYAPQYRANGTGSVTQITSMSDDSIQP